MRDNRCILLLAAIMLTAASYAQTFIVVMEQSTPIGMQTYFSSGSGNGLQKDKIKSYWDEDYYVSSAAHGANGWFVVMSKGLKWTGQSYSYQNHWPDEWVHQQRREGKYITTLTSSDNMWLIVTTANSDFTSQEICSAPWSNLKEWISKWWNNDYYITSATCQNGMWTVVMSKTKLYKGQAYLWATSTDNLKQKISEKWNAGYYITTLEYGKGEYFCIMSQPANGGSRTQHWKTGTSGYAKDIKDYWDNNYRIVHIGG